VGANTPIFMAFRVRKSPAEIERIRRVCSIASAAYASLPERRAIGDSEIGACRKPAATRSAPAQFTSLRTKLTG
jgi:Xaa-Pro aminopeptidase